MRVLGFLSGAAVVICWAAWMPPIDVHSSGWIIDAALSGAALLLGLLAVGCIGGWIEHWIRAWRERKLAEKA